VPRLYIDQGIHHTIAIMNSQGHLPISSSSNSSSNAISARYPLNAICEWSPVVVAEAIDPDECENAKNSNVSAADVVVPPQNPDFNELRHDRLCTTIVSSLDDLDIDEPVHRSSPLARVSNTNTSTQEEDMKLPVWKKKRFVVGIFLMLAFIGTLVAFVSFASPSSKEADESNTVGGGNIRGTTMNSSDTQRSQVTSRRSRLPPIVEDESETRLNSAQNSSISTNIINANTDPWDIDEQDQNDADPLDVEPGDYYSSNSRDSSWTWNNDGYESDEP